ncbi:M16 family metallopeptidase [Lyngbya confervoides]|uniref:Insulinase family protein n=1 Tax=Lyngbya confervoides BDU141951 TaxID=1574623 RepID=A0ABD4T4D3_9CYAN|nr:pitrilysin family protein [Lyngbya confervoides]MCM1983553.1 insulinase family protein [Lyngbya confervoides BDU141951]
MSPAWASSAASSARQPQSIQPYLRQVARNITTFRLKNGLKFIVLERHGAPVVSFLTYADVGGANEPDGQTGVAHYLEHLAFKGTRHIGGQNYEQERQILEQQDQLFAQLQQARSNQNAAEVARLEAEFQQLEDQADALVIPNQMGQIVNQEGGVGLNATTSADATQYFYSFPANKLELWMSLESDRFLEPVFREFYKEKEVILEERRMRTDNSPIGKMVEAFLDTAFVQHPYRRPVIGYERDLRALTRQNVQDFFDNYYGPNNLTIGIVGDVNPRQVRRLAQLYFGRYPAHPGVPRLDAVEPPQTQTRTVELKLPSQPWYLEGYHRPAMTDPDEGVYQLIASILSDGRTSRLYKSLVEEQQVALNAQGFNGFPGDKYPNLMLFYALSAPGHSLDEVELALRQEIDRLKSEPVTAQELDRVKTQAKAGLLRSLDSNSGMANLLVEYEVKTGDWRNLFRQLDRLEAVTAADIQRVAQATFSPENRTIGRILSAE